MPNVLRGEMAKYGLTVADMAKVVGISRNSMSAKIDGKIDFRLTEAKRILAYFNSRGERHTVESLFDSA